MQESDYKKLVEDRRNWYKSIGKVYCRCIEADIVFNSKGFFHILYNGSGNMRPQAEIIERLNLILLVPEILQTAVSIGWSREEGKFKFLIFIRDGVRVIIKKTSVGFHYYHSVMDE